MSELLFANAAASTLVSGITAIATSLTIQTADASKFPAPAAGQYFEATLVRKNTGEREIVYVTNVTGAVFTVTRAQEGTTGITFSAGDIVSLRLTKETVERLYQPVRQGPVVASANDITVDPKYGYCQISGLTTINRISTANRHGGSTLRLKFNGALTVAHNVASGGGFAKIFLLGGANLARTAGQTLNLVYDETDTAFYQV